MFFQISVTPKEKKIYQSSTQVDNVKPNRDFDLVLAPFQPQTRITMETCVNTTTESFLHVKNTSNRTLNVSITKRPPHERNVDVSLTYAVIEANSSTTLEIVWSPKEAGSWRDVLQLTDSRRVKYDIPLVMQAQGPQKKDLKPRSRVRRPLISKSNTTQSSTSSYPSKSILALQQESSLNKQRAQSRSKRMRIDSYLDEPDKENMTKNTERNRFTTEFSTSKKQRKESFTSTSTVHTSSTIHTGTFVLTPVKFNSETHEKMSDTQVIDLNSFSPQEESFLFMKERVETKTLRRETYITTPKYRQNLIRIEENEEGKDEFDDSLSPRKPDPEAFSDFSLLMDNINFTPQIPTTPDDDFEFSPRGYSTGSKSEDSRMINSAITTVHSNTTFNVNDNKLENKISKETGACLIFSPKSRKQSTFLKPTRLAQNFDVLTPITPAPQRKIEFASSSLLSIDYSNLETPRRFTNTSYRDLDLSTAKEVLEADMWVKPENIFPIRRAVTEKAQENKEKKKIFYNDGDTFELDDSCKSLLLEISPPKPRKLQRMPPSDIHHRQTADKIKKISPFKNGKIVKNYESLIKKKQLSKSIKDSIPGVRIENLSLAGISRKKGNQSLPTHKETSVKLHDPNDFIIKFCNPDPFSAATTEDPFLSSTLYYDEKWVFLQEVEFKKWLNTLMTPPEHLNTDVDTTCVDIGKVWQSCRMKEDVVLAESKESISARYHTNTRLNTLRKAACVMFRNSQVSNILSRTTVCIEKGILVIRQDRDLHRDIGLQKGILELFLSYNPLWLRIGLEIVYGETIPLRSNNDLVGLTRFILARFFSDQFIVKQHSHPTIVGMKLPTFASHMNKFMLKKFLLLVFFLDYAKTNKLIGHDPCLFHKKAPHKDSRSILLTFSREVLSGIGDLTKVLRSYGYVVTHKQTYLDEFDYAVNDISSDLRDGVRLCRAMELITGKRNLTCQCRVPAISRLQKIHNVNIALKALLDSGYILTGEIDAKSIADGHREKTLSLLWQIIYKFQAPRFEKAATCLQTWWRSKVWYVRVRNMLKKCKSNAASVIQRSWRCYSARKKFNQLRVEFAKNLELRNKAARVIQEKWIFRREGIRQRNKFLEVKAAIWKIQKWWRRIRETKPSVESFRRNREVLILLQRVWRAKKLMEKERSEYLKLREVCCKIQTQRRAKLVGRSKRTDFEKLKKAVLFVQRRWRASKLIKKDRESFERILIASRMIQEWWRRLLILKKDRNDFLLMKFAVRLFERKWIEKKTIVEERKEYLEIKRSVIIIQRTWRRYRETRKEVSQLKICKRSGIKIQSWWRANVTHREYKLKRNSCLKIQNWWRFLKVTKACQVEYLRKRNAVLVIQKNWRMMSTKRNYWQMKYAVLTIESWYENILLSRSVREEFLSKKKSVRKIENWWLNLKNSRLEREKYLNLRSATMVIQHRWREVRLGNEIRKQFLVFRRTVMVIQSIWRMIITLKNYKKIRKACLTIQSFWRARIEGRKSRENFLALKSTTILIQKRYRANKLGQMEMKRYSSLKKLVILIQGNWRAKLKAREESMEFARRKAAVVKIKNWWRSVLIMRKCRNDYLERKALVIRLQRRYRTNLIVKQERKKYQDLRKVALKIQACWRIVLASRQLKNFLIQRKKAVSVIENWWKEVLRMKQIKEEREKEMRRIGNAAAKIQAAWRGLKVRRAESTRMAELRERTKKAARRAIPAETLANRLQESINVLLFSNDLGRLSMCLSSLDVITRLSPNGCITVCNVGLVDRIYMTLVRSNRSVPWMDACTRATSILVTLAKYSPTKIFVLKEEYIETLARLLTVTVEKEVQLFLHLATLIWVLVEDPDYAKAVLKDSRSVWLLNSLYDTITRKKHKSAPTTSKSKEEIMPNPKPDWGLRQKQPHLFSNVLHAASSILKRLDEYQE